MEGIGGLNSQIQQQAQAAKENNQPKEKPKFKDVWQRLQNTMGARPQKPREVKKTLDKDDFLRIMVTQLKHQDPTKPFEAEKLATEVAQIATVEQLSNVNAALKTLSENNRPLERLAMTNLIGKTVTVDRNQFPHSKDQGQNLSFVLPEDAAKTQLTIINGKGEEVLTKELGSMSQGQNEYAWDGLKNNKLPAESGKYFFRIAAETAEGRPIRSSTLFKSKVVGVSFAGTEPVLLVGNNKRQDKITMESIARIEDGIPSSGKALQAVGGAGSRFIPFKKGEGSGTTSEITPEQLEALKKVQSKYKLPEGVKPKAAPNQQVAVAPKKEEAPVKAEGFPNGLGVYKEGVKSKNNE